MIVTLEKTKQWLRVESNDEDALIESFIVAAEDIISGILRFPLSEMPEVPEAIKQAVYYAVSQLYELRESFDISVLMKTLRFMLSPYREVEW